MNVEIIFIGVTFEKKNRVIETVPKYLPTLCFEVKKL